MLYRIRHRAILPVRDEQRGRQHQHRQGHHDPQERTGGCLFQRLCVPHAREVVFAEPESVEAVADAGRHAGSVPAVIDRVADGLAHVPVDVARLVVGGAVPLVALAVVRLAAESVNLRRCRRIVIVIAFIIIAQQSGDTETHSD